MFQPDTIQSDIAQPMIVLSGNAFQSGAFQSYVFQMVAPLQSNPNWLIKAKKRKWMVFA